MGVRNFCRGESGWKIAYRTWETIKPKLLKKSLHAYNTTSSENEKEAFETSNKKKTESEKGNENLVSNENYIDGTNPEILNSSVEMEKLPNDKTLLVNENTTTSEKRIDRNISSNNSKLTLSYLKRIVPTEKRAIKNKTNSM